MRRDSRSPASVNATLRVVRWKSRVPSSRSSDATMWLSVEGETPSRSAACLKLWWRATARKACMSATVGFPIAGIMPWMHAIYRA